MSMVNMLACTSVLVSLTKALDGLEWLQFSTNRYLSCLAAIERFGRCAYDTGT